MAAATASDNNNHNTDLPTKTKEEGELTSSEDGDENPNSLTVQSSLAVAESGSVPFVQKTIEDFQKGGSNNIQTQTTRQPTLQKNIKKNQLPPKSSQWTGHVGTDKNLVISFSDDDSGSDLENKGNASRLNSNLKRPSSSLVKPNQLKLQQNARSLHKEIPKRPSLSRTFISPGNKIPSSNSKGAGSLSLGKGPRARNFNPMSKTFSIQERGRDQGAVSKDNKLQDLRHQIALRETEIRLKAVQQSKESALALGRDHNAMNLKNDTVRKTTPFSLGDAQLEPKEPDTKRMKLGPSHDTPKAVGGQQEGNVVKSILPSKDSTSGKFPQERNKVDHNQNEIPSREESTVMISQRQPVNLVDNSLQNRPSKEESTLMISQRQPDNLVDNSLQNRPCRSREGNVNNSSNQTEKKSSRPVDPCAAFNQNAMPANMPSNSVPKNVEAFNNAILMNHNDNANVSEHSGIDLQSVFGMEELIDKELEEAQEHRHKCEVEERNALKAYLKAQRSLLEANARCNDLYCQRELYLAKLRSLILNNSSLSWSLGQHQQHIGLDYLPKLGYDMPASSCQRRAEFNNNNSFDSNNRGNDNRQSDTSYHHTAGVNLGSDPCIEPDASTSEPLPQRGNNAADGVYFLDELDISANENEEISPDRHVFNHLDAEYHRKQDSKSKQMDIDTESNASFPTENPQDSLLLEATLRSELYARLGTRAMKRSSACNNIETTAERGAENEVGGEKSRMHHSTDVPLSNKEDNNLKGVERQERTIYLDSHEIQSQKNNGGNSFHANCSAGSGDQEDMLFQGHQSINIVNIAPVIFRSAFNELREMSPFNLNLLPNKNKFNHDNDGQSKNASCISSDETNQNNVLAISMPVTVGNFLSEESSYGCSPAVDPFWPLCMYELRGKCNNNECPWQHAKDYGDGNIYQHQHTDSNNADFEDRLQLHQQNCNGVEKATKYRKATILPTYLVGSDVLKAEQFTYRSVVAHRNTQFWQHYFSVTLATSNLLQNGLPTDGPLSHGGDERLEVRGAWSKHLSFQWRNGVGNQIKQAMADSEQAVEMALLMLNQEINSLQGVTKALSILSKALETDRTSVVLWIVYLVVYHGSLGSDDIFLYAVKLCEGSYVLWLMYINSRKKLDDRLAAYDAALSALCQHASAELKDRKYESACILDLFLQMMDCLCMSGNAEKATQTIHRIFPSTTKSDQPHLLSLSAILNCLTFSDKCVFWVCCVYLIIYRKLPGAVVQKFECEKDLLDIEWPLSSLSENEKEAAVELMETAVESIDSCVYDESMKSEVDLKSAEFFALTHLRCMIALDSPECLKSLLDKYVKLYPSCIELVLVSAEIQKQDIAVDSFMVFDEAIARWPKEVPGIQCIWNQYIANAIHNQRIDLAKEVTVRWFHSVWQVRELPYGEIDAAGDDNSRASSGLGSKLYSDTLSSGHHQMDIMFGYLNLSLYKIFQSDATEACMAIDKAMNNVSFGGLEQSIRKYVMFLVYDASSLKEGDPKDAVKRILEVYMNCSSQEILVPRLLTRNFLDSIKKPRVQHLLGKVLCPVSFDCSLLNLILQSLFGSSLLPQTASDPKSLVDFVEGIMEVVPYNFQLAITVCKLLSKGNSSTDLNSTSLWFWACSSMINAIFVAIPIPPEYIWVEAAEILHNGAGIEAISKRFFRRALSVYPFSIMLWKCYRKLLTSIGDANDVVEAAKGKGINIDLVTD